VLHTNSNYATKPPALAGGQHGAKLVDHEIQYMGPARGTSTKSRQPECIRMRLVFERQVVMGQYITSKARDRKYILVNHIIRANWDATVCEDAIRHARKRITNRKRRGPVRGIVRDAILAVSEALAQHRGPVNHHTVSAMLDVFDLSCSRVFFNRVLKSAGWVPIKSVEMPDDAPRFNLVHWQN